MPFSYPDIKSYYGAGVDGCYELFRIWTDEPVILSKRDFALSPVSFASSSSCLAISLRHFASPSTPFLSSSAHFALPAGLFALLLFPFTSSPTKSAEASIHFAISFIKTAMVAVAWNCGTAAAASFAPGTA